MRRKNKKWKIRESPKIWTFIFREVVASHLFFPHFFDWWSWRSSFAFVNPWIFQFTLQIKHPEIQNCRIFVTNMAGGKHHRWRRGYWTYWFAWPTWKGLFKILMHGEATVKFWCLRMQCLGRSRWFLRPGWMVLALFILRLPFALCSQGHSFHTRWDSGYLWSLRV